MNQPMSQTTHTNTHTHALTSLIKEVQIDVSEFDVFLDWFL